MDTSGQAAEQIVRYSMEGMEYTLKLAGKGTERLAAALLALSQSQQKTKGKTTLHALLKSQKELTVFTIPDARLKEFATEAKRYGVLYCVLKEKHPNQNALCDILVRAEDAAKLNRIVERLGLNQVAVASPPERESDREAQEIQAAGDLLEQILTPPEAEKENPTMAQTEASALSGPGSRPSATATEPRSSNQRPSIRAALAKIRQEQMQTPMLNLDKAEVRMEQIIHISDKEER